jgi:hypothetical protein
MKDIGKKTGRLKTPIRKKIGTSVRGINLRVSGSGIRQ